MDHWRILPPLSGRCVLRPAVRTPDRSNSALRHSASLCRLLGIREVSNKKFVSTKTWHAALGDAYAANCCRDVHAYPAFGGLAVGRSDRTEFSGASRIALAQPVSVMLAAIAASSPSRDAASANGVLVGFPSEGK